MVAKNSSRQPNQNSKTLSNPNLNSELDALGRRRTLTPTGLAQYLSLDKCDRFLRFYLYQGETRALASRLSREGLRFALQPFAPLNATLGDRIENSVIRELIIQGHRVIDLTGTGSNNTLAIIKSISEPVYLYQAEVQGTIGPWLFEGKADLIRISRDANGDYRVMVGDVKSTRKDKVNHRLQVTVYVKLIGQMLEKAGLKVAEFEGTVVRRNPDGSLQDPESSTRFDLDPYFLALEQLVGRGDSDLARVDSTPMENLHYYLDQKCDGCLFNPICMVDSADRQDVALVPFLESSDKRALVELGIKTITDLATLKTLPERAQKTEGENAPPDRKLTPAPGKEALVNALAERWPIGPRLDRLIQRAARLHSKFYPDRKLTSYSYFLDSGRSVLPDEKQYPDLIKVFLDVQTDYLEDRVYLAGARVIGPQGTESIVKMTLNVPDEASERELLVGWITGIFMAVCRVANDPTSAPVHLYLYNRHDQKALLDALRRHLEAFAAIPALYDLLTESPALTQSAVSFVYDEVKERRNLPSTGYTLQAVAKQTGFDWQDEDLQYYRLFEQGMFDYLWQRSTGRRIESAARFYSTIPLEYAYAAWGLIKAEDYQPRQRGLISSYLKVNAEQIRRFQAKRLEALAYIENSFSFKNPYLKKEPLNLAKLPGGVESLPPFRKVLEEFLFIEHYSNLQEHLELFGQTIIKRVQQGRALLVRCTDLYQEEFQGRPSYTARFTVDFSQTGLGSEIALQMNKIKSGDFVVLNPLEADARPWEIVRGRLSIVNSIQGEDLLLRLTDMTFGGNKDQPVPFRYGHNNKLLPNAGEYFLIDEMVDDLNGDKLLEACRNADYNAFYHLMALPHDPATNCREQTTETVEKAREFAGLVAKIEGRNAPTLAQQEVIAGQFDQNLFLVQGPPGTGKSHTLGWAVLARLFAARSTGKPLRVAVSCQTHNAVNIVLQSVATKFKKLAGTESGKVLDGLRLYKVGDEDETNSLNGVEPLDAWLQRRELSQILNSEMVVIGGTPGGLYKIMKQKAGGRGSFWLEKPFDLVILDEASQMNLPQALLASSWLNAEGQLIVVGDHRQMAPILTHSWDEEDRRSAVATQPYRSVFQYLVDNGFPRVALDESFRLHEVHARFLNEHIYRHDGIHFHSRRQQLLDCADLANLEPYLQAVLDPAYPVIVIRHAEQASQQANQTEVNLISPLIEYCVEVLELDADDGIGVVVPHRAQRALLRDHFPLLAAANAIDTVERFQGDERDVIIVSATASDPDYIRAEAEFLLNPNRLNVAFSRPRKKLIVVASATVFNFLTADIDLFNQSVLWKRLLTECAANPRWSGNFSGVPVTVFGKKAVSG